MVIFKKIYKIINYRLKMTDKKRIPHFEKILIGPAMILGEMVTGGHYIETHKILKQSSNYSYPQIAKNLWTNHRFRGFYLGFWPWSVIQITKGLPVLFVHAETNNLLKKYTNLSDSNRNLLSGVVGGMSQGVFVTPTQRLKTIIMTHPNYNQNNFNSLKIIKDTYKRGGLTSFFSGLSPMIIRRGIDWGLRFHSFNYMQTHLQKYRNSNSLSLMDNFVCGFGAGFLSTITTPVDTCIAESQKYSNKNISFVGVIKDIYKNYGLYGFVRGWRIRVLHSCYHTSWVCGLGSVLFSYIRT